MKKITVIDEVQLKQEFKELYKDLGQEECLQVFYELLTSAEIMLIVMKEMALERRNLDD